MFNLYKQDGETLYGIKEFILDNTDDIKNLPTNIKVGSTALIIPTAEIYILNGSKKWVEIGTESGSGEGSDSDAATCGCEDFIEAIDANNNEIVDSVELNDF